MMGDLSAQTSGLRSAACLPRLSGKESQMKNKRLRIGTCVRVAIGVLFILGGICYFLYPNFREWKTDREVNAIIGDFEDNRDRIIKDATDGLSGDSGAASEQDGSWDSGDRVHVSGKSTSEDESVSSEILKKTVLPELYEALVQYNQNLIDSGQQILDAWSYEQSPVDVELLNDGSPVIGYLEIPDMKLKLPLYLGASSDNLSKGAAVMSQTSMPIGGNNTNCVIAGHRGYRGSAFFQYIEKAKVGSKVYITNPWETLTYQVVGTKIVHPNQSDDIMIQKGKDMLTLVTCHPYRVGGGPERYLVFCKRAASGQAEEEPEIAGLTSDSDSDGNQEVPATGSDLSDGSDVHEDVSAEPVEENELQKWEKSLRVLAPVFVVLISCMVLFVHFARKSKHDRGS